MKKCPFVGKKCLEQGCEFWTHLLGKDPQSEATIDKFGCAVAFLPILLVENAQMSRHTAASVDKVANLTNGVKGEINAMNRSFCNAAQAALEMKERENTRLLDAGNGNGNRKPGDESCRFGAESQQP